MSEWVRPLISIGSVLGLLLVLRAWLRGRWVRLRLRAARRGCESRLEALERLPLTPQHTLHLVRVEDRTVLIGVHAGGLCVLATHPAGAAAGDGVAGREASR